MPRLRQILGDAFTLGVILVSDAIDSWASGESREAILENLRKATQRGGELALENAKLKDEIDGLRFNGPSLYKDEAEALWYAFKAPGNLTLDHEPYVQFRNALMALYNRCDHLPVTAQELAEQIDGIMTGKTKLLNWDEVFPSNDPGKDVDEETEWPDDAIIWGLDPNEVKP